MIRRALRRIGQVLRDLEWWLNCPHHGLLSKWLPGLLDGFSPGFFAISMAALIIVILSPSFTAGWNSAGTAWLLVVAWMVTFGAFGYLSARRFLLLQQISYLAIAALLLVFSSEWGGARLDYAPHLFLVIALIFSVIALAGRLIVAPRLFTPFASGALRADLEKGDLLVSARRRRDQVGTGHLFLRALVAPATRPFTLLTPAAWAIWLVPNPERAWWWAKVMLGLSALLLLLAVLLPYAAATANLVERLLRGGLAWIPSLATIVLAVLRLRDFSYVTTMVEASPGFFLTAYVLGAYVMAWLFEYWLNREASHHLLRQFAAPASDPPPERIAFADVSSPVGPKGPQADKHLQAHGSLRLAVVDDSGSRHEVFTGNDLLDLLPRSPVLLEKFLAARWLYVRILRSLAVAALAIVVWAAASQPPRPFLQVDPSHAGKSSIDLRQLLFGPQGAGRRRVVLFAASGGGTRAALYAESILRGLHAQDALDDLVLASGVSGGSATLAYFAMHREELLAGSGDDDAWQQFSTTMSHPFITEVLMSALQWRMFTGTRTGELLAEAFERRLTESDASKVNALGEVEDLGLILNATLTGCSAADEGGRPAPQRNVSAENAGRLYLLTNLRLPPQTDPCNKSFHPLIAGYTNDPRIPLTRAAAASANFPPAFPDVSIDVGDQVRYWITDGGAAENRGILSLLIVLAETLKEERGRRRAVAAPAPLPEIHVVVADASALSRDYGSRRGMHAALAAGGALGIELMHNRWRQVEGLYALLGGSKRGIRLHHLEMPLVFRSRGGVGTHWMLPRRVRFHDPSDRAGRYVDLSGDTARRLIDQLTQPPATPPMAAGDTAESQAVELVQGWLAEDPFQESWRTLVRQLAAAPDRGPSASPRQTPASDAPADAG